MINLSQTNNLDLIRKEVESCIGQRVVVKANKGRKRFVTREGVLEAAYPSIFVVRINNQFDSVRRVSYTYSDILTKTVQLKLKEDQEKIGQSIG